MNLFKTFSLTWWQTGFFKLGLLAAGIAIGAYWSSIFAAYLPVLVIVSAICLAYIIYVRAKQ
jgi:hypothetical protein